MFSVRKSNQRGSGEHGWLHSKHSFSFANYRDPKFMGFRSLRVINEDLIDGGSGFGAHPHDNMEIISYVASGALEHKDSMGNSSVIQPDEVQRMSAGTGIVHSEYNKMPEKQVHLFQIWIEPSSHGGAPTYAQKSFAKPLAEQDKVLVVSELGRDGSLAIKQDADLFISRLSEGKAISHTLRPGRALWLQVVRGSLAVKVGAETIQLESGDGLAVEKEAGIDVKASKAAELLMFDLK